MSTTMQASGPGPQAYSLGPFPLPLTPHSPSSHLSSFTIDAILGIAPSSAAAAIDYSTHTGSRLERHELGRKGRCKRVRTIFTAEQLERLEAEFERQQYMVGPERLYLAHALHLTEAQVKVWFQNRRIKWRKQHLEVQQQQLAALKQKREAEGSRELEESSVESDNLYQGNSQ